MTAKALLVGVEGSSASHLGVQCFLVVGASKDGIVATPNAQREGSRVSALLTVAGRLRRPAKARLRCVGEEGDSVVIRSIQMTAMRAGRLTTRENIGVAATTGSGQPVVVSARGKAAVGVAGGNVYRFVGQLAVGPGSWWFIAKAVAFNGDTSVDVYCRLRAGGDFDSVRLGMSKSGHPDDAMPVALQVVHAFDGAGLAVLECAGPFAFDVGYIVISAIRAGRLTNRNTDGGPQWTTGQGTPRIISGWSNGPTTAPVGPYSNVSEMVLSRGYWMVLAKEWFEADGVPSDVVTRRAQCRTVIVGVADKGEVQYANNVTRVAPMIHSMVEGDDGPFGLKLQCRRTASGGSGDVLFTKMTALRLGRVVFRRL